jgi:hypothetical protein
MSQSNGFVYSSEMVHYSDDMFYSSQHEELIMSDEEEFLMQNLHLVSPSHLVQEIELPLQPPHPPHRQTLPSPFDVSNEEFTSISLSHAMATATEENYRREQILQMSAAYEGISLRDYIVRSTWNDSPTSVCDMEEMEPSMIATGLDIYGFSEDEIDAMEEQHRRYRYDDREARLNYYTSSDEGIPESAFDDTSSVGSINYDSDDDSVLQERYYDEWEKSIKWEVEDKTDPDEHPFSPQKKVKQIKKQKQNSLEINANKQLCCLLKNRRNAI